MRIIAAIPEVFKRHLNSPSRVQPVKPIFYVG